MALTGIALVVLAPLAGCGTSTMILWNPRTGQCDEMAKATA